MFIHTRAGGGDGGVSGGVRTSTFVLGACGGLSQTLLRSASLAAHFHRLRLENLLRQVSLDKRLPVVLSFEEKSLLFSGQCVFQG